MILSGKEILRHMGKEIIIEPFNASRINPNSYNLSLANELLVYKNDILDMKKLNPTDKITIPEEGLLLEPKKLYLGRTNEYTKTDKFVPMLEGRSSTGRLGLFIHVTAGFGDIGFAGYWTLEIFCVQPVIVYPNVEICQIYYHNINGEYDLYNSGKYQNNTGIQPSFMYKEFPQKRGMTMQVLHVFDAKDYDPLWKRFNRDAVRAILLKNTQIALVRSHKEGFFKFPGGGIQHGETHLDTLIRETREEVGLHIIAESVKEYGMLWEIRRGMQTDEIFSQKSYYYRADIDSIISVQKLDRYEAELGYELAWVDIENAYHTDIEIGKDTRFDFLIREAYILNMLLQERGISDVDHEKEIDRRIVFE